MIYIYIYCDSCNIADVVDNAHSANIIFGDCEAKLDEGLLKITNNSEIGLIIHEQ